MDSTPSRPIWVRVVSLVVGPPLILLTFAVMWFYSVPSAEGGWLPATACLLPSVLFLVIGTGLVRTPSAVLVVSLVVAWALGTWAYRTSAPEPERLEAAAAEVGTPAGWRTVSAEQGGDTWGLFGDFPRFEAIYATTDPAAAAAEKYGDLLEAEGWERDTESSGLPPTDSILRQTWRDGRWVLSVRVIPAGAEWGLADPTVLEDENQVVIDVGY